MILKSTQGTGPGESCLLKKGCLSKKNNNHPVHVLEAGLLSKLITTVLLLAVNTQVSW